MSLHIMLLDKFFKPPKFISQTIKVYILSGKYLWLLYLLSFLMLNICGKSPVKKIFLCTCLWKGPGVSTVGGTVVGQLTKQLQRLNSCSRLPLQQKCRTCETLFFGGFLFHLLVHLVFGSSLGSLSKHSS